MNDNNVNDIMINEEENYNELMEEFEKIKNINFNPDTLDGERHIKLVNMVEKCLSLMKKARVARENGLKDIEQGEIIELLKTFSDLKNFCIGLKGKKSLTDVEYSYLKFLADYFIPSVNYKIGRHPVHVMKEIKPLKYLEAAYEAIPEENEEKEDAFSVRM